MARLRAALREGLKISCHFHIHRQKNSKRGEQFWFCDFRIFCKGLSINKGLATVVNIDKILLDVPRILLAIYRVSSVIH